MDGQNFTVLLAERLKSAHRRQSVVNKRRSQADFQTMAERELAIFCASGSDKKKKSWPDHVEYRTVQTGFARARTAPFPRTAHLSTHADIRFLGFDQYLKIADFKRT